MVQDVLFEPLISNEKFEVTDWQEHDLRYLAPMPYSANWSEMGTYKTSTGLWLLQRKKVKNVLLITSKVGKGPYYSDFYKCLPEEWQLYDLGIHTVKQRIEGYEKKVELDMLLHFEPKRPRVFLAHYDVFTKRANLVSSERNNGGMGIVDKLQKFVWDSIWIDEAHRIKNKDTQWTRAIKRIKTKHKHIMTGTGFVNNPAEIWSLLNFLNKGEWSSYWAFRNYYCDQIVDTRGYRIIRGILPHRVEEFRALRKSLGPRHLMHVVHKDIDHPIEEIREVELNQAQRRMYLDIKATLQTLDQKGETLQSPNVLSQLNRLRQISVATPEVTDRRFDTKQNRMVHDVTLVEPSSKLDQVMDILAELDEGQKVVIFSNFKDPLTLLGKRLDKKGIPFIHMEERHSDAQRYHLWHDLFPNGDHKVFMSTLALGGESINLTCAQYLIFLDRSWSPAQMKQAIGRVYRPGQKGAVVLVYINAKKTVDSYVKSKLDTKGKWFDEIFGN